MFTFRSRTANFTRLAAHCRLKGHLVSQIYPSVAVVLSGCGALDGSDLQETSWTLVHLSRSKVAFSLFAPEIPQASVINHYTGELMNEGRSVLEESGRLSRGTISCLSNLSVHNFDAIIIPGGAGITTNLSTFAKDDFNMTINPDVERVLLEFHASSKPIGLSGNAAILAAKLFPGCEVTVGFEHDLDDRWPFSKEITSSIKQMGASHVIHEVWESHMDEQNKVVTTAAFMCDAPSVSVFVGIHSMVNKVLASIPRPVKKL